VIRLLLGAALLLVLPGCASAAMVRLEGHATQGGLMIGHAPPGARIMLDGKPIRPDGAGDFVFGFGRDQPAKAELLVEAGGRTERQEIAVAPRSWEIQHVNGLPPETVTPPPALLDRIKRETVELNTARATDSDEAAFLKPFIWPADGPISGVFGSQRILNGEPRQPHMGLDIAAPEGSSVRAAAAGRVTLAEPDLFYTGGTVLIDHGHGLSTIYVHMSELLVKPGTEVTQGEEIGKVGKTGRAAGPHLHFGVNWFTERLDPALLLPSR
jgi:murein DD-endopeptidase MepM/ murein hydrolase activator NlpD